MSTIPKTGLRHLALREALTEYRAIIDAVHRALQQAVCTGAPGAPEWLSIESIWPDAVVVEIKGQYWQYPYTLAADGTAQLGSPTQVVEQYVPIADVPANARIDANIDGGEGGDSCLIEALDSEGEPQGTIWRVWAIRAGVSGNRVNYPEATLREAAPLFEGVRVFEKSDKEHLTGEGKATRNLVGQLRQARFVEAQGQEPAGIQAELHLLEASGLPPKLVEMEQRDMLGLVGLSINGKGMEAPIRGRFREAAAITQIQSIDLIVEPGAGGRFIHLIEAIGAADMPLREEMIAAVKAKHGGALPARLNADDDTALLSAFREALALPPSPFPIGGGEDVARLQARLDAMEMREAVSGSGLPEAAQAVLAAKIDRGCTTLDLREAIAEQKAVLAALGQQGHVSGLGWGRVETGPSRADKVRTMLDDFFDPAKPSMSFRECYAEITGDRGCTGHVQQCDMALLREAAGADFREAVNTATFALILGDSITRQMTREYANLEAYSDWRWAVDVVPIRDFRTVERLRMGGYGNLPAVGQGDPYLALTTPGEAQETYAVSKRGGTEDVTLETIANDDVGVIRRIPTKLATAAARTLYEFVYDFLVNNPTLGDGTALFHANRGNLGTAALDATSFAAARLAMKQRTELSSGKRLGITLKHLIVPSELEETVYNLFVRNTNLDQTFVQSRKPTAHVVDYWTDTNNWVAAADKADIPLIEIGFLNGNENPELFVQDLPTQGSLFSNDKITWKIRHVYGGNVLGPDGFYKAVVA